MIEEKTTRIVEIVIASVRPTELMLGKIIGIGLVGRTQYLVWSLVAMNSRSPASRADVGSEMGVRRSVSRSSVTSCFLLLGYCLYASIYTAIGAPFNTDRKPAARDGAGMFMVGVWAVSRRSEQPHGGTRASFAFPMTAPLVMSCGPPLGAAGLADLRLRSQS